MKNGIFKLGKTQFDVLQKAQQYRNMTQTNYQKRIVEAVTSVEPGTSINDHDTKTIITDQDTASVATYEQNTTSKLENVSTQPPLKNQEQFQ